MTLTANTTSGGPPAEQPADLVGVSIDGFELSVPKGTLVIRAAELIGIQIPRFCDHPLLDPVGACRQCLVEIEGQRKPLASCTTTVTDGMVVRTQLTSPVADKAQHGIMEMLLINHPLDCPVCDKGGECPLQNQAMSNGPAESRFRDVKRTFPKPIAISTEILLDRERCVLCARCTRFSAQIAGDPFIELLERGALEQVGIYEDQPFHSYFSGNTVQICPVGALTSAAYRFRARPFDLVSTPSACEHCASGCALRTDHRRGKVMRRLAGDDPSVNEEWNCDKGRFAFAYPRVGDRLTAPMVRDGGRLVPTSWPDAFDVAARGLAAARGEAGVLTGGRLTLEDAYAYAKFARMALGSNDVDFRARPHSDEEAAFLAALVAGRGLDGPTYESLEHAPVVLLAGLEPEEESPIIFLRLRKATRRGGLRVFAMAPYATRGLQKLLGQLIPTAPGTEAQILSALAVTTDAAEPSEGARAAGKLLRQSGAVVLVGERLAAAPGALSAVAALAEATGAALGWVPRRAGDRGALEAGALPGLLPGGRPVADPAARAEVARLWAAPDLPAVAGRSAGQLIVDAAAGRLRALVVGGVDPDDLPDPALARQALERVPFLVSLELRESAVTELADVVFPVAAVAEKAGTFLDWEGRERAFPEALRGVGVMSDARVLTAVADEMDIHLGLPTPEAARHELTSLGRWGGARPPVPTVTPPPRSPLGAGEVVLATWAHLIDEGRMLDGEPQLAGTAPAPLARLSAATAAEVGVSDGDPLTVSTARGSITLPLLVTPGLADRVVWLPTNSPGSAVRPALGADSGTRVRLSGGRP